MANKGAAALDDFISGVLSKITDPDQKRKADEALTALKQVGPVAAALGDGVAGQAEIDRRLQELTTQTQELDDRQKDLDTRTAGLQAWHGDLSTWHSESKALLEDGKKFRAGGGKTLKPGDAGYVAPSEPPKGVLTEDQFKEAIGGERAAFLGFSRDQNLLTREHFAKFGEIVELEPLLRHPKIAEVGLLGVYEIVHKDRLDKHRTDETAKHDKDIADTAVRDYAAKQASMPYPSPTGAGSGSPLDALTAGAKDSVVDAASAHYARLQQERNAAVAGK